MSDGHSRPRAPLAAWAQSVARSVNKRLFVSVNASRSVPRRHARKSALAQGRTWSMTANWPSPSAAAHESAGSPDTTGIPKPFVRRVDRDTCRPRSRGPAEGIQRDPTLHRAEGSRRSSVPIGETPLRDPVLRLQRSPGCPATTRCAPSSDAGSPPGLSPRRATDRARHRHASPVHELGCRAPHPAPVLYAYLNAGNFHHCFVPLFHHRTTRADAEAYRSGRAPAHPGDSRGGQP